MHITISNGPKAWHSPQMMWSCAMHIGRSVMPKGEGHFDCDAISDRLFQGMERARDDLNLIEGCELS